MKIVLLVVGVGGGGSCATKVAHSQKIGNVGRCGYELNIQIMWYIHPHENFSIKFTEMNS